MLKSPTNSVFYVTFSYRIVREILHIPQKVYVTYEHTHIKL